MVRVPMQKRLIVLLGNLKLSILLAALILSFIASAEAALLCSESGPYISSDYLEVSDFRITGPEPLKVGDTMTVSFTLESVRDPVRFGDNGVFVAAEDPDGIRKDFGHVHRTDMLQEGERINFEASMTVDKGGNWTLSPVYSTVDDNTVHVGYRFESKYANPEIRDYFSVRSSGTKFMAINGKPNLLSPIILEMGEDEKQILESGGSWDLENGYSLVVGVIDLDGDKVHLSLVKGGEEVESSVLKPGSSGDRFENRMFISGSPGAYRVVIADISTTNTFVYQKDVGSEENVPIFSVYVDIIFAGMNSNIVKLKYAMLIDDDLIETDADPEDVFRVMIEAEKRNPPATPDKPSGTSSGQIGTSYTYRASATDPNNDQVRYTFDWGDGNSITTDYVDSGLSASASHSWTDPGSYIVKVTAVDDGGMESGWSEELTVTITITTNATESELDTPSLDVDERGKEMVQIIGVILVIVGLVFIALTAVKKDVTIELGVSERTIKYVGGTGIVLIIIGVYMLLKSAGLI